MHQLLPPLETAVDPLARRPRVGSYRGPLPPIDLGPLGHGPLFRLARHKRWLWGGVFGEELLLGFAVVDLGYVASAFAWAYDRAERRMLADRSALGPGFCGSVGNLTEEGCEARIGCGRDVARIVRPRGSTAYEVELALGDLQLEARLETAGAPAPMSAIVEPVADAIATTQKRVLLPVRGRAVVAGRSLALDGALGGLDYSHGYPPRRTVWKWGFALGRARSGEPVAFNIVEGFVGEPECTVWVGDELFPVGEGRFTFDAREPLAPWHVHTTDGAVELDFAPGGAHREDKNLGLIVSRFAQVAGDYRGTIVLPGRAPLELAGVPGVAEDQDMLW
jgi:hypothetical protein